MRLVMFVLQTIISWDIKSDWFNVVYIKISKKRATERISRSIIFSIILFNDI